MNVGILGPSVSNGLGKPSATPRDLGSRPLPLVEGSRYPTAWAYPGAWYVKGVNYSLEEPKRQL